MRGANRWLAVTTALAVVGGIAFAAAPGSPANAAPEHTVVLDGGDEGRRFDGVGGVSAGASTRLLLDYPKRQRDEILDYLFEPGYGASLDILKVEIGGDVDSTAGAEASHMRTPDVVRCDRGYEWWLMREAKERNPGIELYGLPWGAPGWFDGGYWSKDRVDYLVTWLDCAKRNGFTIDYLGAGNESEYDRDVYVQLAAALDRNGYSDVEVVGTDEHHPPNYWYVVSDMRDDPEFADAVDILGQHDVCVWRTQQRRCHVSEAALGTGKPLWDSENSTQDYAVGRKPLARAMNRHYVDARVTGNLNWALVSSWYDSFPIAGTGLMLADRPWSGSYEVGPSIWVDAHTTQFTEPGWRYLDGGSGYSDGGASYVSLRSPETGDYTTVVETLDLDAPETMRFRVGGGLSEADVQVWSSDLDTASTEDDFVRAGSVRASGGSFELRVEPGHVYTVSTTTGQRKGDAQPPAGPGEQLRLPYQETFERAGRDRLATYVSDVHGGFEATPCAGGREGTCYEQVVTEPPLSWHDTDLPPTTLVGDPRWWGDYEVTADVLLRKAGAVELLGRVDSQQHNAAGYHLRMSESGAWRLYAEDNGKKQRTLASGSVDRPGAASWHELGLRFTGDRVTALYDGDELATVEDDDHVTGQVGLRVDDWARAQFDDVSVTPTAPAPRFVPHEGMTATATSEHASNEFGHTYPASAAVDDRLWSSWRSRLEPLAPLPQTLTLDLGRASTLHGLAYTPPVAGASGTVTGYAVLASADGEAYREVARGTWRAGGGTKTAPFDDPVRARYVKLRADEVSGCPAAPNVAEVNVSTTPLRALGEGEPVDDPVPDFPHLVPKESLEASATSQQSGYEASRAVDGDCATMWHTAWSPRDPLPQSVTLDLGRAYDTEALVYQPRQDATTNGMVTSYEIAVSSDGEAFEQVASGSWQVGKSRKLADWTPTEARYVRLTGLAGAGDFLSAAELDVAHTG